ncbi:hypothetical protein TIFTF001_052269 [Ficus carica]|uniref:Uncharacterized protein n=1 Tax=Ficus carica TaxID=3494 RepID=A0AA88EG13_FICCA|nr:hypothetical protein TIFTF001_052269 [Ficus carica]
MKADQGRKQSLVELISLLENRVKIRANNSGILKVLQNAGAHGIEYIRFQYPENQDLASTAEKRPKAHGKEKGQTKEKQGSTRWATKEGNDERWGTELQPETCHPLVAQ